MPINTTFSKQKWPKSLDTAPAHLPFVIIPAYKHARSKPRKIECASMALWVSLGRHKGKQSSTELRESGYDISQLPEPKHSNFKCGNFAKQIVFTNFGYAYGARLIGNRKSYVSQSTQKRKTLHQVCLRNHLSERLSLWKCAEKSLKFCSCWQLKHRSHAQSLVNKNMKQRLRKK